MKLIFPISFFLFLLSCISCSDDAAKGSAGKTDFSKMQQTDSGHLEIKPVNGLKENEAVLYDDNGKVIQRGKMLNQQPVGAWVKYDTSGKVISAIHYSKGKPAHTLDPEDFNFVPFTRSGLKATFSIPKKWKENPQGQPGVYVFYKESKDASKISPNFTFHHEKLQPGDSLENVAEMQLQVLHENVGRVDLVDEAKVTLDSCRALRLYGMFTAQQGTTGFLNAIIISGDDIWFFSAEAPNNEPGEFLTYQGVFQAVLESFRRTKN